MSAPDPTHVAHSELFELGMLGGAIERRYRKSRPEVERLPWKSLRPDDFPHEMVLAARQAWTEAAFQEHRTAAACSSDLQALIAARAPVDLIAMASRFPLDEIVHVELCARLATELGGGIPIRYDPLGRIVKDEAAHGQFGWVFLDWALPHLDKSERQVLREAAGRTVAAIREGWDRIRERGDGEPSAIHALGWMRSTDYLELARRSMESEVLGASSHPHAATRFAGS